MLAFDWASTALGPTSRWPASLKSSVRLLLDCRLPMYLAWGPDFTQFFNDAYVPILGAKHEGALGGDARVTWSEIWPTIGPMWHKVLSGEGIGAERFKLTIDRFGYFEDCYFSFSYSPVPDDDGNPAGVLVTFAETTKEVLTEQRQTFQLSLADAIRKLNDPVEIAERAVAMLGHYVMAGRAGYGDVDAKLRTVSVTGGWTDGVMGGLSGETRPLDSFGPAIIAELEAGRTLRLDDIAADARSAPYAAGYASIGTKSLVVVPLLKGGALRAILYLHCAEPRVWTGADVAIAEEVAQRTWDAIERAYAERELSAERARLQAIVDTIPTGLIMLDQNGTFLIENAEWKRTWAGSGLMDGVVDYHSYKGFRPDTGERIADSEWPCAVSLMQGITTRDVILDIERFDGTRGTIVVSSAPVRDASGRVIAAVAANMDISELRMTQSQLEEANRRQTEFLATLAHELRNPLAPIRSGLAVLGLSGDSPEVLAKVRGMMERQVNHMVDLIDDLLDIARISGGKLELKKTRADLRAALSTAVESSLPVIEAGGHTLRVDLPERPLHAEIDATRIAQVVANLLNNSAKYTPPGGAIELVMRREENFAAIRVTDNGVGIPAADLSAVFDMFSQVRQNLDRSQGGLGIGLSLVRRLVEMHGGTVSASSPGIGAGSTFVVRLPLIDAARDGEQAAAHEGQTGKLVGSAGLDILVVDDNVDAARTFSMLLELQGHRVRIAHDGVDALSQAKQHLPRLVFLDIGMPRMDGYDTARAMREVPALRHSFIVAVTGWGSSQDRARAQEAGFNWHLTKPVRPADIDGILARAAA